MAIYYDSMDIVKLLREANDKRASGCEEPDLKRRRRNEEDSDPAP